MAKNPKNLSCKTINLNFSIKDHTSDIQTDKTSALRIYAQWGKIFSEVFGFTNISEMFKSIIMKKSRLLKHSLFLLVACVVTDGQNIQHRKFISRILFKILCIVTFCCRTTKIATSNDQLTKYLMMQNVDGVLIG